MSEVTQRVMLGPAALCRLDASTVAAVASGEGLRPMIRGSVLAIVLGAGAYGATMGLWRGPLQSVFAATKLVSLFAALWALTTLTNFVVAALSRAKLSAAQVATCSPLGLAVTAIVLGALAPVSWFLTAHAPALSTATPQALDTSFQVAQELLGAHVIVFAIAGCLGVLRMWGLLRALVDRDDVARRVLWAWLAVEGLVGAELSWVLRPFVGKPNLPITLLRSDAFASSFFDEVDRIALSLLGPMGTVTVLAVVAFALVLVAGALAQHASARFVIEPAALVLTPSGAQRSIVVPWDQLRSVRRLGAAVEIVHFDPETLREEPVTLPCENVAAARHAFESIELARARPGTPFRTAPYSPRLT